MSTAHPAHSAEHKSVFRRARASDRVRRLTGLLAAVLLLPVASAASAQRSEHANWALADKFNNDAVDQVVHSTSVQARFINETDSLWYFWRDQEGAGYGFRF
jgi:hypothetical protein